MYPEESGVTCMLRILSERQKVSHSYILRPYWEKFKYLVILHVGTCNAYEFRWIHM